MSAHWAKLTWPMIKRTIEISTRGAHVSVKNGQLRVAAQFEERGAAPCEDVGVLLLDSPALTCTGAALAQVAESEGVVVVCGKDRNPVGLLWPLEGNILLSERVSLQAGAGEPLKKRLWKQIVQRKVKNQAAAAASGTPCQKHLEELARTVRSGDPGNVEAQAAKAYWSGLFPEIPCRRRREGPEPNPMLNYGYMVLRAGVVRAICAAGLHPALGLHHRNRYNSFCLADDLLEPYRPYVDARVRDLLDRNVRRLERQSRHGLLALLGEPVRMGKEEGPMMVAMQKTAVSLVRCLEGKMKTLALPAPC